MKGTFNEMNNNTETSKTVTETGETNIRLRRTLETKPIEQPDAESTNTATTATHSSRTVDFNDVSFKPEGNWEGLRNLADTILNLSAGLLVRSGDDNLKNTDDAANELILFLSYLEKGNAYDNIAALKDYLYTWTTDFRESQERYENGLKAKSDEQ